MMKTKLTICALAIAGLAVAPLAAQAKSHKHHKHSSMSSSMTTTGANMKPSGSMRSGSPAAPSTDKTMAPAGRY